MNKKLIKQRQLIKLIVFLSLLFFSFLIILRVENMLLSCVLAFVFSYLLEPVVNSFERTGVKRVYAIIVSFIVCSAGLAIAISFSQAFFITQISSLKSELPKYIEGTRDLIEDYSVKVDFLQAFVSTEDISERIETVLISWTHSAFEDLPNFLSKSLMTLFLAPFFTFFLLLDGKTLSRFLLGLVPNNYFELTLNLYSQINSQMGHFVRARLLEAAIVGFIVAVGLRIFDFPYSFLLGVFALLTNLIPYVGPLIGAVPAVIIALLSQNPPFFLLIAASVYGIAQVIDMVFIIPLVVAKIVDLHPVTVVVAILIGAQLMGVLGMLISIPMASALKLTVTSLYRHLVEFRA